MDEVNEPIVRFEVCGENPGAIHPDNPVRSTPPPEADPLGGDLKISPKQSCCATILDEVACGLASGNDMVQEDVSQCSFWGLK